MAGRYSSSADMYPPLRQQQPLYDPVSYAAGGSAATSRDYLGEHSGSMANPGSPHLGYTQSHSGDSTAFLAGQGSGMGHGEKYSDGSMLGDSDGPPEHMLRSHNNSSSQYRKAGGFLGAAGSRRRRGIIIGSLILLAVIIAAVIGGVVAARNSSDSTASSSGSGGALSSDNDKGADQATRDSAITGANGSIVTMEDGTKFTYVNNFGGHWVATPFSNDAQAQSYSKPLNQSWDFQNDK